MGKAVIWGGQNGNTVVYWCNGMLNGFGGGIIWLQIWCPIQLRRENCCETASIKNLRDTALHLVWPACPFLKALSKLFELAQRVAESTSWEKRRIFMSRG
jgi:hypothetical protein